MKKKLPLSKVYQLLEPGPVVMVTTAFRRTEDERHRDRTTSRYLSISSWFFFCQCSLESGVSLEVLIVVDGDGDRFCGADEVDLLFAASDSRVEEIAMEHLEVRRMDRQYDARTLAALVFMHGGGVGNH